jgi:ATP-dependent DNA helicase RecQ
VPPYVVFHDATLRELARALPCDEKSFLAVKGAGPGRWQRYGERVVAITRLATPVDITPAVHEAEEQQPLRFAPSRRAAAPVPAVDPAVEQVARASASELWGLCAAGATLGEICNRLRRSAADVANELANGALDGRPLDVGRLLGAERVEAIVAAARGANGDVVAVRRRLAFPAALAEIRLAITTTAARARRGV